jgi:SAM-dependent methyltransferase
VYETLASVYEWLVPDELLEPEGAAAAFGDLLGELAPGARVLDCAAGTGQLAVGLALRGFDVTASDASAAMVGRTRALAAARGAALRTATCTWEQLGRQGWGEPFDAVFCVGNSLAHAEGRTGRRAALAAMVALLRPGGLLVLTSRNWERVRATRDGLEIRERLVERGGRRALVVHHWTIPERWDERHRLDVAVALIGAAGEIDAHGERLDLWAFSERDLDGDLRAAGLEPAAGTYTPDAERYLVSARRPGGGAGAGPPRPAG